MPISLNIFFCASTKSEVLICKKFGFLNIFFYI